ncbi:NAD-binding protein [Schizopora paradoxa]|uniref:NAD-binding protein n=1 Tax=Schizopora paradoxa TaxID=27342 RepID=A0A0H2RMH5_9AGAM|nr:NAD-binding protein [Schizopora paradoxa]
MGSPFILVTPATRGLSLAITRQLLRTTRFPVFATHRSSSPDEAREHILEPLKESGVDPKRLSILKLDLTSESSIKDASATLREQLPQDAYLHTGFFTGGILYPEKQPADIDFEKIKKTFQINVLSHLLLIKHFNQFLPDAKNHEGPVSKWVHISARVGSISDNHKGGWYSYRASKAALNQVIKTFDTQLALRKTPSICVGIHPGTVKTQLSKDFWSSVPKGQLFEPEEAAEKIVKVVDNITEDQRGRVWDYAGKQVPW